MDNLIGKVLGLATFVGVLALGVTALHKYSSAEGSTGTAEPQYTAPDTLRTCTVRHPTGELLYTRCRAYNGRLHSTSVFYYQCEDGDSGFGRIGFDTVCTLHDDKRNKEIAP